MKINSISIQELSPVEVIGLRHVGPYEGIAGAFEQLSKWAAQEGLFAAHPRLFGVYHDDPCSNPAEKLRSDACIEKKSHVTLLKDMEEFTITGGKYLVFSADITMSEYGEAWKQAYEEMNEKGYAYDDRHHYESYNNDPGEEPDAVWSVNICIPMK